MKTNKKTSPLSIIFALSVGVIGAYWLNDARNDTPNNTTGEENLSDTIALRDVQTRGDARLKRIFSELRHSKMGEDLYTHALNTGVNVAWENDDDGAAGAYHGDKGLLTIDTHSSDAELISVMAHELRHHWQFTATRVETMTLDPLRAWQAARLLEVDACAYTAKFITEYNVNSTREIDIGKKYGHKSLAHYSAVPAAKRDYIKDAIMPCFQEIAENDTYNDNHIGFTETLAGLYKTRYQIAVQKQDYDLLLREYAQMPTPSSVKKSLSPLLSPSLDPTQQEPAIKQASDNEFLNWLHNATANKYSAHVLNMQREFELNRMNIMERAAPAPSS